MKKTKKTLFLVLAAIVIVGAITLLNKTEKKDAFKSFNDSQIMFQQLLEADEDGDPYYVYIYSSNDKHGDLEDTIRHNLSISASYHVLSADKYKDNLKRFDWSSMNTTYDKEVGEVVDGKIKYNKGYSQKIIYNLKDKDPYGNTIVYRPQKYTDAYAKVNKNAKKGKVYARVVKPIIDYGNYKDGDKLTYANGPTLLHIKDKKIDKFYYGESEITTFFENK